MAFSHQFSVFGETPSFKLCNTSEVPGGLKKDFTDIELQD